MSQISFLTFDINPFVYGSSLLSLLFFNIPSISPYYLVSLCSFFSLQVMLLSISTTCASWVPLMLMWLNSFSLCPLAKAWPWFCVVATLYPMTQRKLPTTPTTTPPPSCPHWASWSSDPSWWMAGQATITTWIISLVQRASSQTPVRTTSMPSSSCSPLTQVTPTWTAPFLPSPAPHPLTVSPWRRQGQPRGSCWRWPWWRVWMVLGLRSQTAPRASVSNKSWSLWAAQACVRVTWSWRLTNSLYRDSHTPRWWSCSRSVLLERRPAWWFREVEQVRAMPAGRDGVKDSWLSRSASVLSPICISVCLFTCIIFCCCSQVCLSVCSIHRSTKPAQCSTMTDWCAATVKNALFALFSLLRKKNIFYLLLLKYTRTLLC